MFPLDESYIAFSDLTLFRYRTNRLMADHYRVRPDAILFGFNLPQPHEPGMICGVSAPPGTLGILPSGRDYFAKIPPGYDLLEIEVSNNLLLDARVLPESLLRQAMTPERALLPCCGRFTREFSMVLRDLLALPKSRLTAIYGIPAMAGELRRFVLDGLRSVIESAMADSGADSGIRLQSRYQLFRRACDAIEDRLNESLSLSELAKETGSPPRTLQRAFQDVVGVSPYQYALARRIHAARDSLLAMEEGGGVITQVAHGYGFGNPGRFSGQFRRLLGETPSQILQRRARR